MYFQVQQHLPAVNAIAQSFVRRVEEMRYVNDEISDLRLEVRVICPHVTIVHTS